MTRWAVALASWAGLLAGCGTAATTSPTPTAGATTSPTPTQPAATSPTPTQPPVTSLLIQVAPMYCAPPGQTPTPMRPWTCWTRQATVSGGQAQQLFDDLISAANAQPIAGCMAAITATSTTLTFRRADGTTAGTASLGCNGTSFGAGNALPVAVTPAAGFEQLLQQVAPTPPPLPGP